MNTIPAAFLIDLSCCIVPDTNDLGDLQGNTLVPNSPYLSGEQAEDDNGTQINDPGDLDKRGNPMACIFVAR